jgi:hypothetical protein
LANESGPLFVARPITGIKNVLIVSPWKMRWVEGQRELKIKKKDWRGRGGYAKESEPKVGQKKIHHGQ